ncbi:hypothetical protein [Paenibacillus pectinilyticus]|uniref:hypothetical protein n=1 Tax=Paenibacillus pectinilyticus TaxID=512399 RepID=UPI00114D257F|nr:hypothetical protein [Paenibacillus pectinilyticus]
MKTQVLTWNPAWINPFESGWSIFEKIKYSNVVTSLDLVNEFGIRNASGEINRQSHSLFTLNEFDHEYLTQSLGFNVPEHLKSYIFKMIGIFPKNLNTKCLIRSELTYCVDCLSMGYHSLLHQFSLLHKCPFHLNDLMRGCNNCGYKLDFRTLKHRNIGAFQCKCSKPINPLKFTSESQWSLDLSIKDELLLNWLEVDLTNSIKLKNTYFDLPILINRPNALLFLLNSIKSLA